MTEYEWLNPIGSQFLLIYLRSKNIARSKNGRRKLRLFACGFCRSIWDYLTEPTWRDAVDAAEQFALGLGTKRQMELARSAITEFSGLVHSAEWTARLMALACTELEAYVAARDITALHWVTMENRDGDANFSKLIHDIFGNPFRPVIIDPRWLSSTVVDLANAFYEERAFENMPILADALMDAGCDNEEIIAHCRNDGPHVRGCWVIDLLTGKE